ncbi:thiol-disulfide oxidoreductase DCC family protein [Halobellus salinisoli]|uniref:thiol-disulfide oxidoreductase DCC family protein n=1 Tax=Halobellus salinisoli TaxID=3108500 RepID=UPI003008F195
MSGTDPGVDRDGDGDDGDSGNDGDAGNDGDDGAPGQISEVPEGPVILFDGVCNLCNGVVSFLIPRDPEGRLRFAPLQSEAGRALLARHDLPAEDLETVVLVEGDRAHTKSDAAIRVAELLGWPYRLLALGWVVPRGVRDGMYGFVAENRYEWFGRKEQCMVPDEDVSDRFLG